MILDFFKVETNLPWFCANKIVMGKTIGYMAARGKTTHCQIHYNLIFSLFDMLNNIIGYFKTITKLLVYCKINNCLKSLTKTTFII